MPTSIPHADRETASAEHDHHSIKLWLRLLTCTNLVEKQIRDSLRQSFDTTLPRFDFLAQLERAKEGLSMSEISQRMMVSGGNVTGLTNQLLKEGYVVRDVVPKDRRTAIVKLTPKGRRNFQKMAKVHEQWVVDMLGELTEKDVEGLMHLLGKIKKMVVSQQPA